MEITINKKSSEQMNAQAEQLKASVNRLIELVNGTERTASGKKAAETLAINSSFHSSFEMDPDNKKNQKTTGAY